MDRKYVPIEFREEPIVGQREAEYISNLSEEVFNSMNHVSNFKKELFKNGKGKIVSTGFFLEPNEW